MESGGRVGNDDIEQTANSEKSVLLSTTEEDDFLSDVEKNIPVELMQTLKTSSFTQ